MALAARDRDEAAGLEPLSPVFDDRKAGAGDDEQPLVGAGVTIVCSTDAHSVRGLGNMELSVATARRGWASPEDVPNTGSLDSVLRGRRSLRS